MSYFVSNAYVGGQAWILVHATVGVQFTHPFPVRHALSFPNSFEP